MKTWVARAIRKQIMDARQDHSDFVAGNVYGLEKRFFTEWQMKAYTRTFADFNSPAGVKYRLVAKYRNWSGSYEAVTSFSRD